MTYFVAVNVKGAWLVRASTGDKDLAFDVASNVEPATEVRIMTSDEQVVMHRKAVVPPVGKRIPIGATLGMPRRFWAR